MNTQIFGFHKNNKMGLSLLLHAVFKDLENTQRYLLDIYLTFITEVLPLVIHSFGLFPFFNSLGDAGKASSL